MDWRFIGSSFTPSLDGQGSHVLPTTQPFAFAVTDENRKPPKYSRWQYIVGVPREEQQQVLEKLEEVVNSGMRRRRSKPVMELEDFSEKERRYYLDVEEAIGETELMKEKVKCYKELSLSPYDTPSVDAWLKYIKAKGNELVATLQNNQHDIPEWMMPRLSEDEEVSVATQNAELLHKMSSNIKKEEKMIWRGKQTSAGMAYLFTIILFYKNLLVPDVDVLTDSVKWMKSWTNDYMRINELKHNFPVWIHQAVSIEPVYWNYITSMMMQAKMAHTRFIKLTSYFFKYLKDMLDTSQYKDKIQKCIIILFTECLIPRLMAAGYEDLAINLLRNWLGYNLFKDNSCDNFAHAGKHYLLNDLASLRGISSDNKSSLMDLCDAVDYLLSEGDEYKEQDVDYSQVSPMNVEDLPIEVIKLDDENVKELLFRVLEILGCESVGRLSSKSRWYNFAKGMAFKTKACKRLLVLVLLHSIIALPKARVLTRLLMRVCKSKEVSKKILQLYMEDPDLWTCYAMLEADKNGENTALSDALNVFPSHIPLLVASFVHHMEHGVDSLDAQITALSDAVENHDEEENIERKHLYEAEMEAVIPSRKCAAAILWTLTQKNNLNETRCRSKWNDYISLINEYEAHLVLKVVCKCLPAKTGQKLAEYIVKLYSNNEDIIATYVEYAISRANKNMIKQILISETTQPQLSVATRHMDCFTRYTEKSLFDFSSTRLMLLCRIDDTGDAVRTIMEEPMPFKIPNVRTLQYILDKFRTKYDSMSLLKKNCPFSKALWLKLIEHLPASSEIMEEEMRSYGINI